MEMNSSPILYSLHNCPYAIRARFALLKAQQSVLIRSIKLDNKPVEMLNASPKGSVPVLVIPSIGLQESATLGEALVLDESLDIIVWSLSQSDPDDLLRKDDPTALPKMMDFIHQFEQEFNPALNAFGCAKRYHEENEQDLRDKCSIELAKLEALLSRHPYLFSDRESLVDIAVMPFLRKFARIDKQWFRICPYPRLRQWLNGYVQSTMFSKVMKNYPLWLECREDYCFG
ncbi:glutathione S-transferase [Vibrio maerlii]|uniref:glutathione S-transferase n=1 Tax=Vibrio maerlii TaxID=2231648 RepID=UPI000E3E8071|nr:glutathione S-transferase [Vibrio maerlii]